MNTKTKSAICRYPFGPRGLGGIYFVLYLIARLVQAANAIAQVAVPDLHHKDGWSDHFRGVGCLVCGIAVPDRLDDRMASLSSSRMSCDLLSI